MLAGQSALKCQWQTLWLTLSWMMLIFVCDAKVRAYKNLQNSLKNVKTPTKTIKRLQIPKTRSLCFLNVFDNKYPQKMGKLRVLPFFCMVLTELSLWKKHGHDGWSSSPWGGASLILWETIWSSELLPWPTSSNQSRGLGSDRIFEVAVEGIKCTTRFLEISTKTSIFSK